MKFNQTIIIGAFDQQITKKDVEKKSKGKMSDRKMI